MDELVALNEDLSDDPIPLNVLEFVAHLNWLRDEGFINLEEDEDGLVRAYPATV